MPFSGHNFIAGQRSALGDTLVYSVDAHTGERLPGGFHQATLDEARGLGLQVIPWTVNETADMERLIDRGVHGLITDRPDRLRQVLSQRPAIRLRLVSRSHQISHQIIHQIIHNISP